MASRVKDTIEIDDIILDADGVDWEVVRIGDTAVEGLSPDLDSEWFKFCDLEIEHHNLTGKSTFRVKQ